MKLYLISRTDGCDYQEYDSFVVAAKDEKSALEWCPNGKPDDDHDCSYEYDFRWTTRDYLKIECIGESNSLVEKVIISSFNAE